MLPSRCSLCPHAVQSALLSKVVRLPQSFFDSQPTGRLLNRFTKDTEAVDTAIGASVMSFLNCAVRCALGHVLC